MTNQSLYCHIYIICVQETCAHKRRGEQDERPTAPRCDQNEVHLQLGISRPRCLAGVEAELFQVDWAYDELGVESAICPLR